MSEKQVGIRALKQNASEVIQMVKQGDVVVITERGVPVAQISPIKKTRLQELIDAGLATPATRDFREISFNPTSKRGLPSSLEMIREQRAEKI
jgi:prevent-host-death family protein